MNTLRDEIFLHTTTSTGIYKLLVATTALVPLYKAIAPHWCIPLDNTMSRHLLAIR